MSELRTVMLAILNYPGESARLRDAVGSILYDRLLAALDATQPPPESAEPEHTCDDNVPPSYCDACLLSESAEPAPAHVEALAAKVHESWMAAKLAGHVTSRKSETGEELMVPYDQLSEQAKELDRVTVRTVLAAQAALAEPAPVATDTQARCEHRDEDEGGAWLEETRCKRPATRLSCNPFVDAPTCDEHGCRCPAKPLRPATPAPARDAEVSHAQARSLADALPSAFHTRGALLRYISQQEARQQQAEREVDELRCTLQGKAEAIADLEADSRATLQGKDDAIAELTEKLRKLDEAFVRAVEDVNRLNGGSPLKMVQSLTAQRDELSRKLEAAERDMEDYRIGARAEAERCDQLLTERNRARNETIAALERAEAIAKRGQTMHDAARAYLNNEDKSFHRLQWALADWDRASVSVSAPPGQAPPATETEDPTCSGEWLSGSGGPRVFGGCGRAAVWVEHGTGAAFCDEHGPTFRAPRDQAPPAKPLTCDDVRAITRAVVAELAEQTFERLKVECFPATQMKYLAEAAKEESGGG